MMNYERLILSAEGLPFQIHSLHLNLHLFKEIEYEALKITSLCYHTRKSRCGAIKEFEGN